MVGRGGGDFFEKGHLFCPRPPESATELYEEYIHDYLLRIAPLLLGKLGLIALIRGVTGGGGGDRTIA